MIFMDKPEHPVETCKCDICTESATKPEPASKKVYPFVQLPSPIIGAPLSPSEDGCT